jgi:hypothetical protein
MGRTLLHERMIGAQLGPGDLDLRQSAGRRDGALGCFSSSEEERIFRNTPQSNDLASADGRLEAPKHSERLRPNAGMPPDRLSVGTHN